MREVFAPGLGSRDFTTLPCHAATDGLAGSGIWMHNIALDARCLELHSPTGTSCSGIMSHEIAHGPISLHILPHRS